jgi:hypothetical protein
LLIHNHKKDARRKKNTNHKIRHRSRTASGGIFVSAAMNDIDGLLLHFHPAAASCLALPSACHASAAHIRAHAWQL